MQLCCFFGTAFLIWVSSNVDPTLWHTERKCCDFRMKSCCGQIGLENIRNGMWSVQETMGVVAAAVVALNHHQVTNLPQDMERKNLWTSSSEQYANWCWHFWWCFAHVFFQLSQQLIPRTTAFCCYTIRKGHTRSRHITCTYLKLKICRYGEAHLQ